MSNPEPLVLGINRTQDASVCLMRGSAVVWAIQKERLTREKHHWGALGDLSRIYRPNLPNLDEPIDLVVECYSSDKEFARLAAYRAEIEQSLRFRGPPRIEPVSHHLAHLYSAYFPSGFRQAAVMVADFMGSPVNQITETWPGRGRRAPFAVEVASFYDCVGKQITCIGKQFWDRDPGAGVGLGFFYQSLTNAMFPGEGNEGKVMGLAAYADADELRMPPLVVEDGQVLIPPQWFELFADREHFGFFSRNTGGFEDCARLAAAGQRAFEDALLRLARWLHRATGKDALCFAGGTALNCVANGRLLRESPFTRVFVPPAPHDGGTAIGCALYGMLSLLGGRNAFRWDSDFLAPPPAIGPIAEMVSDDPSLLVERVGDPVEAMADLLAEGWVVGLYQGGSEFGPRALGHRSILADPTCAPMRDWINANIKGREWFRPLAPMTLWQDAKLYFDLDRPSPHMLFAANVTAKGRDALPAITHIDGTARVQTVGRGDAPLIYALLHAVKRRTGHGVLLNTSFNGQDEPIVETVDQAVACFRQSGLHALVVPPYVVTKRERLPLPGDGRASDQPKAAASMAL